MSLLKCIFYSLIAYFVLRFVVRLTEPRNSATRSRANSDGTAHMVRCSACGTFVAEKNALVLGGRGFCSTACVEKIAKTST